MDAKEIKRICDFLASMQMMRSLAACRPGIVVQHGYFDHHIGNYGRI